MLVILDVVFALEVVIKNVQSVKSILRQTKQTFSSSGQLFVLMYVQMVNMLILQTLNAIHVIKIVRLVNSTLLIAWAVDLLILAMSFIYLETSVFQTVLLDIMKNLQITLVLNVLMDVPRAQDPH